MKNILVGVTGGIAAFKSASIVSLLKKRGYNVKVVMTKNATNIIGPLTLETLSRNRIYVDMWDTNPHYEVEHISLADWADIVLIAPATYNIIGKVANGIADDMLSTTIMATTAKVIFVPSMNTNMYENPIVQENIKKLRKLGYIFVEPESGHLACNASGKGRFPSLEKIIFRIERILSGRQLLKGKRVIISAGGTKENIDPVRYIGNRSSGRMGYAIARAAAIEAADVVLVSCTEALPAPEDVRMIYVRDACELDKAMKSLYEESDIVIMAAAVSDYRPIVAANQKIKKEENDDLMIHLSLNPDILFDLGQKKTHQFLVGFAAETNDVIAHGRNKVERKNLDMLIANDVAMPGAGFNVTTNIAAILYKDGTLQQYPKMSKEELGKIIIEKIAEKCN